MRGWNNESLVLLYFADRIENKTASKEKMEEALELRGKIALLERKMKEMQQSLPSQAG